eukprot:467545-Pelagomonas_calceolata.AAC.1
MSDSKNLIEPIGAGITNTIGRAELAAIPAAHTHKYTHLAMDSLSSLHQLRKQILYPKKHRRHVQGDVLKTISNLACTSQAEVAKYQTSLESINMTDTNVPGAGPCSNPSTVLLGWLGKRQDRDALKSYIHDKYRLGYVDCKRLLHLVPEFAISCKEGH